MKGTWVTFKTELDTCKLLTFLAHQQGMTQSELINKICVDYINEKDKIAKIALQEEGYI